MSVQETLGDAFESVANLQNSVSDAKDIIDNIEHNNPIVGDL